MSISFNDRVAIVTGSGNGLGKAHAVELAKRGAKLVINDFGGARDGTGGSASPAETTVAEIIAAGGEAIANDANVTDYTQCEAMVDQAIKKWGRVDVLINNAGILRDKSFAKMDTTQWQSVVDVHLNGSANCSRAVWKHMQEQNFGRILMTTSTSGIYGNFGQANYGAAKMGLIGMMNTLCIEGAKNNIHINCLAPTAATRMTEDILNEAMLATLKPEYVVPAAVYLVSEEAPNRTIMFAGAGSYSTLDIRETAGIYLKEDERNADAIAENFSKISDTSSVNHYSAGMEQIAAIIQTAMNSKS